VTCAVLNRTSEHAGSVSSVTTTICVMNVTTVICMISRISSHALISSLQKGLSRMLLFLDAARIRDTDPRDLETMQFQP